MVNLAIAGKKYPKTDPYLVGREKVREFARAVFSESAAHINGEVAPPTFAVVIQDATLQQLLSDEEAGVDFSRVVHGDQRFSYTRPIVAGDEITATLTVKSVKKMGGHFMVTSESEMVDAAGKHVVTAVSTLVVRGDE